MRLFYQVCLTIRFANVIVMMSGATAKLIRKLKQKKYRYEHKLFIAEGDKVVQELLIEGLKPKVVLTTSADISFSDIKVDVISHKEMKELSSLSTAPGLLAVFPFPGFSANHKDLVLVLDAINDPGNLGTIIRTADWFGVKQIIAIEGSTDCFNPKCVQSTMGSIARVEINYLSRENALNHLDGFKLWGADMNGTSVSNIVPLKSRTALIMGSESHGYDNFWNSYVQKVTIPRGEGSHTESLNVAVATSILLAFLRS